MSEWLSTNANFQTKKKNPVFAMHETLYKQEIYLPNLIFYISFNYLSLATSQLTKIHSLKAVQK